VHSGLWGVLASNHSSVTIDTREEGGRQPITVDLKGLDEDGMRRWWKACQKTYWSLLNTTCSQMAVDALRAGGGDRYVGGSWVRHYFTSHSVVWRPSVVLDYAQAVRASVQNQRA
jgi:hypothetical protein